MGNKNTEVQTEAILRAQRRKFLWIIGIIFLISVGLLASTTVLAVKVIESYKSAKVELVVWSGPQVLLGEQNSMKIKVPHNSTVFTLMEHGAQEANHFSFEYEHTSFGRYISSIGGVKENVGDNTFWILYHLQTKPDPKNPPQIQQAAEIGVDDLRVESGDVVLFWLTKFQDPDLVNYRRMKHQVLKGHC